MRKIISLISALATVFSVSFSPVRAISEPQFDDDIIHYSHTRYLADTNNDGELNISDLVYLSKYLHENITKWSYFRYDINMDVNADVFDLIVLRQSIIYPEKAFKQTITCDMLKTVDIPDSIGAFISSKDELNVYLSGLGIDEDEINQYLDNYDSSFFEKNDLVLGTLTQSNGKGIHHIPDISGFINLSLIFEGEDIDYDKMRSFFKMIKKDISEYESLNFFFMISHQDYKFPPMIYPEKKSTLLFQCNVPKTAREVSDDIVIAADFNLFTPLYSAYKYESYDKKKRIEVYVADDSFFDPDYSFYIYYFDENGNRHFMGGEESVHYMPFFDEGKWTTDNNGNHSFSGGDDYENFDIKWTKNSVIVKYVLGSESEHRTEYLEKVY